MLIARNSIKVFKTISAAAVYDRTNLWINLESLNTGIQCTVKRRLEATRRHGYSIPGGTGSGKIASH
jgi:hypothetical protein